MIVEQVNIIDASDIEGCDAIEYLEKQSDWSLPSGSFVALDDYLLEEETPESLCIYKEVTSAEGYDKKLDTYIRISW